MLITNQTFTKPKRPEAAAKRGCKTKQESGGAAGSA
jgi:hypothetical protein